MASTSSGSNESLFRIPDVHSKQNPSMSYSTVVKTNSTSNNNIPTIKITENSKISHNQQKLPKINDTTFKEVWKAKTISMKCAVAFEVKKNFNRLDYLDAIALKTNPDNVFSICKANNKMVVYFNSEQTAKLLIRDGIEIQSTYIPGLPLRTKFTRVVLSNVDPCIDDSHIVGFLRRYGKPTTDWLRPIPINSGGNEKYTHIISHRREIYMETIDTKLPERIIMQMEGYNFNIYIAVEGQEADIKKTVHPRLRSAQNTENHTSEIVSSTPTTSAIIPPTNPVIIPSTTSASIQSILTRQDSQIIEIQQKEELKEVSNEKDESSEKSEESEETEKVKEADDLDDFDETIQISKQQTANTSWIEEMDTGEAEDVSSSKQDLGTPSNRSDENGIEVIRTKRHYNAIESSPESSQPPQKSKAIKQEILEASLNGAMLSDTEYDSDGSNVSCFSNKQNELTDTNIINLLEKVKSKKNELLKKKIIDSFTADYKALVDRLELFRRNAHNIENLSGRPNDWVQRAKRLKEFINDQLSKQTSSNSNLQ